MGAVPPASSADDDKAIAQPTYMSEKYKNQQIMYKVSTRVAARVSSECQLLVANAFDKVIIKPEMSTDDIAADLIDSMVNVFVKHFKGVEINIKDIFNECLSDVYHDYMKGLLSDDPEYYIYSDAKSMLAISFEKAYDKYFSIW